MLASRWKDLESPHFPEDFSWQRVSKRYLKKVSAIIHESNDLRSIFEAQTQANIATNIQELTGTSPDFDLASYAEGLREEYSTLRLESLDTKGVYYNQIKLWKIFIPQNARECQDFFPQLYELPKEQAIRLREQGYLNDTEISGSELSTYYRNYLEQPEESVLKILGDLSTDSIQTVSSTLDTSNYLPLKTSQNDQLIPYIVILGDPGSGKSTLLQYLALSWAELPLNELPLHPIPLLIELRNYARDKQLGRCSDILSFLHKGNLTCRLNQQQLHAKLKTGHVIALLDGIDEIFDRNLRDEVTKDIHRFTNSYKYVRVIVTSRWLGYQPQRLISAGFRHFMLQDLDTKQIKRFIHRWHDLALVGRKDKSVKQARLKKAVEDSKAVQELAGNPLLLTMMAILNLNQELPRDRPELYYQASRVLLHQWDLEAKLLEDPELKNLRISVDYKDKQAMLRKVAYYMQASKEGLSGNLINSTDLENILTDYFRLLIERGEPRMIARVMIEQFRNRNFILCSLGADRYAFVHRTFLEYFCAWEFIWQFKETQKLKIEQLKEEVFGKHWEDEAWHEVLRLISGMLDESFSGEIISYLLENFKSKKSFYNIIFAAECFVELRRKSLLPDLECKLFKELKLIIEKERQLETSVQNNRKYPEEFPPYFLEARGIHLFPKANSQKMNKSGRGRTSEEALKLIVKLWENDDKAFVLLKDCAQPNNFWNVQYFALHSLAKYWTNEPDVLPLIKFWIQNGRQGNVVGTAIQELAKRWRNYEETFSILENYALSGDEFSGRLQAIKELANGWRDERTLEVLRTCSREDENYLVRERAIEAIEKTWRHEPWMLDFLVDTALNDPFEREENWQRNPRKTALKAILKEHSNHPHTQTLLANRADNDSDEDLREFAKNSLRNFSPTIMGR